MSVFLNIALDSQCFLKVGVNAGTLRGKHWDENPKFPCQLQKLCVVSPQIWRRSQGLNASAFLLREKDLEEERKKTPQPIACLWIRLQSVCFGGGKGGRCTEEQSAEFDESENAVFPLFTATSNISVWNRNSISSSFFFIILFYYCREGAGA